MASAKLQKNLTRQGLYKVASHNYRTKANHSNKDIDPTRTHLNRHYGPQTVQEFRERFKSMIKDADEKRPPKRVKKDRQTMLEVIIWSPREGMSPEDEAAWSKAAYEVVYGMYGEQIVGATYHADEVHDYTAPDNTEHVSRGHTHLCMIPWDAEKGLNMDAFYKRSLPNKINAALDEKCKEMFGYPYRDGSQAKSRQTVEELKLASTIARREKEENKLDQIALQHDYVQEQLQEASESLQQAQEALQSVQGDYSNLKADCEVLEGKYDALEGAIGEATLERDQVRAEVRTLEASKSSIKAELMELANKLQQGVIDIFKSLNKTRKKLSYSPRLSDGDRERISHKADNIAMRTEQAIEKPLASVEDYLSAWGKVQTEKVKATDLEQETKALEEGWERDD